MSFSKLYKQTVNKNLVRSQSATPTPTEAVETEAAGFVLTRLVLKERAVKSHNVFTASAAFHAFEALKRTQGPDFTPDANLVDEGVVRPRSA